MLNRLKGVFKSFQQHNVKIAYQADATMAYIIRTEECTSCATCVQECPMDAIIEDGKEKYIIISDLCTDCGSCADVCPEEAIRGS